MAICQEPGISTYLSNTLCRKPELDEALNFSMDTLLMVALRLLIGLWPCRHNADALLCVL